MWTDSSETAVAVELRAFVGVRSVKTRWIPSEHTIALMSVIPTIGGFAGTMKGLAGFD